MIKDKEQCERSGSGYKRLVVLLAAAALTGCAGNDMSDLKQEIATIKAKPPGKIEGVPTFNPVPPYPYVVSAKRDPFARSLPAPTPVQPPDEVEVADEGPKPPPHNPEPLEAFPLDTLKYVGILEKDGETWAIITAPDDLVYRVKHQNFLGQNYGRIVGITETEIEIVEIVPTGHQNRWVERRATLALE